MRTPKSERHWYALYTRSRSERKVHNAIVKENITAYLPMIKKMQQWSDRKKLVDRPLFNSYVFVFANEKEYLTALNVDGAVKFISFEGKAVPIPEKQIIAIKRYIDDPMPEDEEVVALHPGQLLMIKSGPMKGLIGELVSVKNKFRLVLHIDAVGQVISLSIPRSKVEPIDTTIR